MAEEDQIIAMLKTLAEAFPGQRIEKGTILVYLEHLCDIPSWLLKQAVQRQIESSTWFPKIADIRQTAARLANTSDFANLPSFLVGDLMAEAQALEDAFFYEGHLDLAEWEALAGRFEGIGRPYRAAHTREKLRRLQTIRGDYHQGETVII